MLILGPLGFTAPWLLTALAGLPLLWWLLRAVPPAPAARVFPGVTLLLGLEDRETQTDRTPWWLLLLRLLALAAIILGFAGPVLNPETGAPGRAPLLVLIDDSWAAAPDWRARRGAGARALAEAASAGRPTMLLRPSAVPTEPRLALRTAKDTAATLAGLTPVPWTSDHAALLSWLATLDQSTTFDTLWISDGLATPGRAPLARALQARGGLRVLAPPGPRFALRPARIEDGLVHVEALRLPGGPPQAVDLIGHGPDPAGVERELFRVTLADDTLRRRKVALVEADAGREGLELLSPLHYLREALAPTAGIIEGPLADLLPAAPDVVVLADVARLSPDTADALATWVAEGGLLLRFAGPRLAASDTGRGAEDPLLPVRLRVGGRSLGGAMSWGEPRRLAPFPDSSPFYGLPLPDDVTVTAQVLAEPGPMLAERTIAALADGTPLVTRKPLGDGQVVLFHSSANAEWSSLALSGLFVQMLERLAISTRAGRADRGDLAGTLWQPAHYLDGFGRLEAAGDRPGVAGERLGDPPGPALPPGLYGADARVIAVNAVGAETTLAAAEWPAGVVPEWQGQSPERDLSGWLFLAALALLGADILAALWLTGRLARGLALLFAVSLGLAQGPGPATADPTTAAPSPAPSTAATDPATLAAALNVTLAHVLTGEASVDEIARAGLAGLTDQAWMRSSVEASAPVGLDLETDELAAYPLIYWPVTETQPTPSAAAYARLNAYLRAGGMILFDTRDGDIAGFGSGATPEGARLQSLARPLDIPPLEPVPADHVLTRSFYLLSDFPGRFTGSVWVEAAPADAERAEGMPFRNLNDGVTPVVIGGNDWAGAWAVDETGRPLLPVGRGLAGERQRELAYRFGVNLVMHVLTGNYKSDQVHVPALLERLGQ